MTTISSCRRHGNTLTLFVTRIDAWWFNHPKIGMVIKKMMTFMMTCVECRIILIHRLYKIQLKSKDFSNQCLSLHKDSDEHLWTDLCPCIKTLMSTSGLVFVPAWGLLDEHLWTGLCPCIKTLMSTSGLVFVPAWGLLGRPDQESERLWATP